MNRPKSLSGKRRGRDSNPRYGCPHTGFRDRPIRPLWHLSKFFTTLDLGPTFFLSSFRFTPAPSCFGGWPGSDNTPADRHSTPCKGDVPGPSAGYSTPIPPTSPKSPATTSSLPTPRWPDRRSASQGTASTLCGWLAHQIAVTLAGGPAALVDGPDHQALSAPHVPGREHPLDA